MAIPKLLEQMRHAVQDTGDEMTGGLSINNDTYSTLTIGNNDDNSLIIGKNSLLDSVLITANGGIQLTNQTNKIDFVSGQGSISGLADPTETDQVATKNYVDNNGGTFYATYGTTTYADVVAAYNAGKTVKALYSDTSSYIYIFDLVTRPTGNNTLYFTAHPYNTYANTYDITLQLTSASAWSVVSSSRRTSVSNPLQYNGTTTINTNPYYRPIRVSTSAPTSSDGNVGDIWIQYFS